MEGQKKKENKGGGEGRRRKRLLRKMTYKDEDKTTKRDTQKTYFI